ncbi:unnamed protein product [Dovyalis caffra]|uniref:Nudix hydrolase domain-containing protein n=1 Tax=Dovyalis caffra TaxID=77055 RepID=A0AAV1R035_9ROSI|nr:unnamed protein product [Dovyalis caffra]
MDGLPSGYRPNVGVCLINSDNLVFVVSRLNVPGAWQMPQGGIEDGEEPKSAAIRELLEETGVVSAEIIAEVPNWLTCEWHGQAQKWFLMRLKKDESEINLASGEADPEFAEWKWANPEEVIEQAVDYKRPTYEEVMRTFRPYLNENGIAAKCRSSKWTGSILRAEDDMYMVSVKKFDSIDMEERSRKRIQERQSSARRILELLWTESNQGEAEESKMIEEHIQVEEQETKVLEEQYEKGERVIGVIEEHQLQGISGADYINIRWMLGCHDPSCVVELANLKEKRKFAWIRKREEALEEQRQLQKWENSVIREQSQPQEQQIDIRAKMHSCYDGEGDDVVNLRAPFGGSSLPVSAKKSRKSGCEGEVHVSKGNFSLSVARLHKSSLKKRSVVYPPN